MSDQDALQQLVAASQAFAANVQQVHAEVLAAALDYAARGYPVFPVGVGEGGRKVPYVRWRLGEPGHEDIQKRSATTDHDTIRAWWARWPGAMIGMPTGQPTGTFVLDVDCKRDANGLDSLQAAGIDPFALTQTVATTPSGGLHFYFRDNGGRNSAGRLPGVDVRANGGMVLLPPSMPPLSSAAYAWLSEEHRL